jgi:hypothetical protein
MHAGRHAADGMLGCSVHAKHACKVQAKHACCAPERCKGIHPQRQLFNKNQVVPRSCARMLRGAHTRVGSPCSAMWLLPAASAADAWVAWKTSVKWPGAPAPDDAITGMLTADATASTRSRSKPYMAHASCLMVAQRARAWGGAQWLAYTEAEAGSLSGAVVVPFSATCVAARVAK